MGLWESWQTLVGGSPRSVRNPSVRPRGRKLVEPDARPLWKRLGLSHHGMTWSGDIRGHRGGCTCLIEKRGDLFRVWVRYPPRGAFKHWHAGCLRAEKNGWYSVHIAKQPRNGDVNAVIIYLQRWISECQALDR